MKTSNPAHEMLTFGGHLEVLRQMLFRILTVTGVLAVTVFCLKDLTFTLLLAPNGNDFVTYCLIERAAQACGVDFRFEAFRIDLIATDLSSQFMTHLTTSLVLGVLFASPYILFEVFRFVSPALYESERRHSTTIAVTIYMLFAIGVLMTYYVLFPVSLRFLGTYSVSEQVHSTITLDSYISTFTTLTFLMGAVFQLPVITYVLGKMGVITSGLLSAYRRHALLLIMVVSAIITPPDIMTLALVSVPLYGLYEVSVCILRYAGR